MSNLDLTRLIIAIVFIVVILLVLFIWNYHRSHQGHRFTTAFIARVAVFAAISVILYVVPYLKFPLPIFPNFLEIHFDELPALIASFAYGPGVGSVIILIKTLIKLPFTTTLCVGELADLIYGLVLVIPAGLIYKKYHSFKGGLAAALISGVLQIVVASFITSWPILDFYMAVMGFSEEQILSLCQLANPNVTSLGWTFLGWIAVPFNALKDILVIGLTLLLYRRIETTIVKAATQRKKEV